MITEKRKGSEIMTLGVFLGLAISMYLLVVEPIKKSEKINNILDQVDLDKDIESIDKNVVAEIKKAVGNPMDFQNEKAGRKVNILMARFM